MRFGLIIAKQHPPGARREQVDLLRAAVVVALGPAARRHRGLGERLVGAVAARHARELADLGAVERDERPALVSADDLHGTGG